jgi:hypothetical protein
MTTPTKILVNERYIALVGVLNRELAMLERLAFKLTEAELLVRAEETRFLTQIFDEVDDVSGDLGALEVARSMLVGDVTAALGLGNDTLTLRQLVEYAPDLAIEPLQGLLRRLSEAVGEITDIRERGSRVVIERLDRLTDAVERADLGVLGRDDGYDHRGFMTPVAGFEASRFDLNA